MVSGPLLKIALDSEGKVFAWSKENGAIVAVDPDVVW